MLELGSDHTEAISSIHVDKRGRTCGGPAAALQGLPLEGIISASYAPREDLFLEGDRVGCIFEIAKGIICGYRLSPDGTRHVVSFYFPGDLIACCWPDRSTFSAQALTPVRVRRIPKSAIDHMIEQRPGFARQLLDLTGHELAVTRDHLMCIASKSAEAKIAGFLLALQHRNRQQSKDPDTLDIPMTRVDIGDYLGLTIETVSRTLTKLRRSGVIDLPKATTILIKSGEALQSIAGE